MRNLLQNAYSLSTKPRLVPAPQTLEIDGRSVVVEFRRNAQARRLVMRMLKKGVGVSVTLPPGVGDAQALAFVQAHEGWIKAQLKTMPEAVPFATGSTVPFLDELHEIVHDGKLRGAVRNTVDTDGQCIIEVSGAPEHIERRINDWMKREARKALAMCCARHAETLGLKYSKLTVRDQSSRWGSCSSRGTLSFSWRLIMAPYPVLDYVAAHEVAHLAEMNHSDRFWRLVETAFPDMKSSRQWLRKNGSRLHRYGGAVA